MPATHTVCITAHYAPERVEHLATVLDAILGWHGCAADVHLITNTRALRADATIGPYERRLGEIGSRLNYVIVEDLTYPFELTWRHKPLISEWRRRADPDDLFVYLEDDMVLGEEGLRYFQAYRPILRPFGLIPSFVRFERLPDAPPVVVDLVRPEFYGHRNSAPIGDVIAHVCRNPYWAGFILDRDLADEYVGSRSFGVDSSRFVRWDLRARAAMGPCFERVPAGFSARNAVVLKDGRPVEGALIWHCSNTYARAGSPRYARVPVAEAFVTGSALRYQADRVRARLGQARIESGAAVRSRG